MTTYSYRAETSMQLASFTVLNIRDINGRLYVDRAEVKANKTRKGN